MPYSGKGYRNIKYPFLSIPTITITTIDSPYIFGMLSSGFQNIDHIDTATLRIKVGTATNTKDRKSVV